MVSLDERARFVEIANVVAKRVSFSVRTFAGANELDRWIAKFSESARIGHQELVAIWGESRGYSIS